MQVLTKNRKGKTNHEVYGDLFLLIVITDTTPQATIT